MLDSSTGGHVFNVLYRTALWCSDRSVDIYWLTVDQTPDGYFIRVTDLWSVIFTLMFHTHGATNWPPDKVMAQWNQSQHEEMLQLSAFTFIFATLTFFSHCRIVLYVYENSVTRI